MVAIDMTVQELADRFGRCPSTVRAWCEAGRLPGAYKLRGREWRIPAVALRLFQDQEGGSLTRQPTSSGKRSSLADWRRVS